MGGAISMTLNGREDPMFQGRVNPFPVGNSSFPFWGALPRLSSPLLGNDEKKEQPTLLPWKVHPGVNSVYKNPIASP